MFELNDHLADSLTKSLQKCCRTRIELSKNVSTHVSDPQKILYLWSGSDMHLATLLKCSSNIKEKTYKEITPHSLNQHEISNIPCTSRARHLECDNISRKKVSLALILRKKDVRPNSTHQLAWYKIFFQVSHLAINGPLTLTVKKHQVGTL